MYVNSYCDLQRKGQSMDLGGKWKREYREKRLEELKLFMKTVIPQTWTGFTWWDPWHSILLEQMKQIWQSFGLRKTSHYPLAQVTLMFLQVCFSKKKKKEWRKETVNHLFSIRIEVGTDMYTSRKVSNLHCFWYLLFKVPVHTCYYL